MCSSGNVHLFAYTGVLIAWGEEGVCGERLGNSACIMVAASFFNFFFSVYFYFWDRERQSMNGGGAEREGDTESETGSRL